MRRVVITGGPATGKTSLIQALNKIGNQTFPEVARQIIKEQLEIKSNLVPWYDVSGFSKLVLEEQLNHFNSATNKLNFYDRGIPDLIGYLNHGNQPIFDKLNECNSSHRYNTVFILPPWKEIYETDNERRENFEDAVLIYEALKSAYSNTGYDFIIVPKLKIKERLKFILDKLNE